jgi:hypothetical protein
VPISPLLARTERRTAPLAARVLGPVGSALRSRWALPVFVLVALAVSLWVQHVVYPHLSWNRDEPVYLWHAEVLRAGNLTTPDGGFPDLFQPWLSATRNDEIFSQYTLGWPLVVAAGLLLGNAGFAIAAGAALAVAGTWTLTRELFDDRVIAGVAAALMVASPIFAVQGGVYLNYLFALGLGLLFLTSIFSGVRLGSPLRLLAAGGLLGWIALTRPYDAVVWAALAGGYLVARHWREWKRHVLPMVWVALGAAPLVALLLVVNRRLTGSPLEFPITVADPLDRFGFGTRRLMPRFGPVEYGRRLAVESSARNGFWLPVFMVGAHLGVVLALVGAWIGRRRHQVALLAGLVVAFPLLYFPFFGMHISSLTARLSGPIYYIPAYAPLCMLAAFALVHIGRRYPSRAVAALALLLVVTVPVTVDRLGVNRELSLANQPWEESVEHLTEPSLVIVSPSPYLMFLNPFGHNGAHLDRDDQVVLYANDNEPEMIELVASMPERTPYLQRASLPPVRLLPSEHPEVPDVALARMSLVEDDGIDLDIEIRPQRGDVSVAGWVQVGRRTFPLDLRRSGDGWEARARIVPREPGRTDGPGATADGADGAEGDRAEDDGAGGGEAADGVPLEVDLGDGSRIVQVVASWRRPGAVGVTAIRRSFPMRSVDGRMQILFPGTSDRAVGDLAAPVWEPILGSPRLRVSAAAGTGE